MSQSNHMQIFILNLEKWRVRHNLSQAEFAKRIGLSASTYNKLVSGDVGSIKVDTLKAIYDETGLLCHMLMEVYDDEFLKLTKLCRNMSKSELHYMLYMAQNLILLRENKL